RERGPQARRIGPCHPCEQFSTGVARAGNTASETLKSLQIGDLESAAKSTLFVTRPSCTRPAATYHRSLFICRSREERSGLGGQADGVDLRGQLLPQGRVVRAAARLTVPDVQAGPARGDGPAAATDARAASAFGVRARRGGGVDW